MMLPLVIVSALALSAPVDSTTCPNVFGDVGTQQFGADLAAYQIHNVVVRRHVVTVFHGVGAWRTIQVSRMAGLDILRTDQDGAVVRLAAADKDGKCAGTFRVKVGTHLGEGRVIVATVSGGLLVASDESIVFVPGGEGAPRFDLIWQSGYHLLGATASASASPSARSKPKPKSKGRVADTSGPKKPVFKNPEVKGNPFAGSKLRPSVSKGSLGSAPKKGASIK